ncbi:ndor1, partial [Symbiodinium microadriaticum]
MATVWEVVGGAERGGIIVRTGYDLSSDLADSRLATGSLVKETDSCDGRICYELLRGEGPASGWVSPNLRGKELLIKTGGTQEDKVQSRRRGFSQWASRQGEEASSESTMPALVPAETASESSLSTAESPVAQVEEIAVAREKKLSDDDEVAFRRYTEKFGECRDGSNPGYSRKAFPWFNPKPAPEEKKLSTEALEAALACKPIHRKLAKDKLWEVDSEGEEVPLCPRCSLPVGEFAYQGREGKQACVHTECMAQVMSQEAQREEDARVKRENVKKEKNRREYDIGWRMDSVPKSAPWAERMGCRPAPQGLCCLVLDEASRTVKVAATAEPSAAVNLEYLLLALKVRKTASREPLFSLDPVDPQNLEKTPQKKVYEPSWLAGTSVGDVMFQADYFLKELALGEYDMPVVGMLSVFD